MEFIVSAAKRVLDDFHVICHVNNLIKRGLKSARIPTILEPQGVSQTDDKKPDGMTIFPLSVRKCLVRDFTCSDTLATSHIAASSVQPGKVAEHAEQTKLTKYVELERDFQVVPVCVETVGPWGFWGLKFIQEVRKRIAAESGVPRSTTFLMQSIGIAIQRGNAASVVGTVPKSKPLDEVYYL